MTFDFNSIILKFYHVVLFLNIDFLSCFSCDYLSSVFTHNIDIDDIEKRGWMDWERSRKVTCVCLNKFGTYNNYSIKFKSTIQIILSNKYAYCNFENPL